MFILIGGFRLLNPARTRSIKRAGLSETIIKGDRQAEKTAGLGGPCEASVVSGEKGSGEARLLILLLSVSTRHLNQKNYQTILCCVLL